MKRYKGIIFDLDGTLVNTLEDLADSVNEALEKMGYPVWAVDDYRLKVGWKTACPRSFAATTR